MKLLTFVAINIIDIIDGFPLKNLLSGQVESSITSLESSITSCQGLIIDDLRMVCTKLHFFIVQYNVNRYQTRSVPCIIGLCSCLVSVALTHVDLIKLKKNSKLFLTKTVAHPPPPRP